MRRLILIAIAVVAIAGIALLVASKPELLGGDTAELRRHSRSFLEDLQFKDFKKAASYHEPAKQRTVDIPFLLERLFFLKPEQLDVMEYEILFSKIDSSGMRGRVKTRIKVKDLTQQKIRKRELMLYYYRKVKGGPFFMRLESSLRDIKANPKKAH